MVEIMKSISEGFSKNIDFIIKTLTIVGSLTAMVSVILLIRADIKSEVTEQINNPMFVNKVAAAVRAPYLLFNSEGIVIFDGGATSYIDVDGIKIENNSDIINNVSSITIKTTELVNLPPVLTSIDREEYFHDAERAGSHLWKYNHVKLERLYWNLPEKNELPLNRYRLEILR